VIKINETEILKNAEKFVNSENPENLNEKYYSFGLSVKRNEKNAELIEFVDGLRKIIRKKTGYKTNDSVKTELIKLLIYAVKK